MKKPQRTPEQEAELAEARLQADKEASFLFNLQQADARQAAREDEENASKPFTPEELEQIKRDTDRFRQRYEDGQRHDAAAIKEEWEGVTPDYLQDQTCIPPSKDND